MSKKYPPIRWWSDVATKIESGFANTAVKIEEGFAKLASTKNTSLGQRFRNFMGKGHSTMPWWFYFITLTGTNFFVISQIQRFVEYQEENHRQLLLDEFSEAKYAKALSNLYQFRKWFDKDNGANELPWVTKFKDCTGKDYRTDSDGYWKSGCDCSKGHSRCFWTKMQIYNQAHDLVPINSISKANKPQEDHDVLQTIDQSRRLLWIFGMRLYLTQHESKKVNCTTWAVNFLSGKNHESITVFVHLIVVWQVSV
jgi:hypothetical protein